MQTYLEYTELVDANLSALQLFTGLEWIHEWTGGNCDAFVIHMDEDGNKYWMVTVGGDASAPTTTDEWQSITLGYYDFSDDGNGDEGVIVETVTTLSDLVEFCTTIKAGK